MIHVQIQDEIFRNYFQRSDTVLAALVQQVRGSIPGGVVNFHLKIFNFGARRGGDVHFLIARLYIKAWNKFQTLPQYIYWEVLLIAIRPSVGDIKPGGPLGAFREEQAMSQHWVSPPLFLSSSSHTTQHNTTTQTVTHAVTLTSISYGTLYRYSSHT